jgi:Uma2 family endonuclease
MSLNEIVLPETKPETEWILGRPVQKVSPPDVAFEILSAADRVRHVAHKISVYLAAGTALVVVVEPRDRTVHLHDARGERVLRGDDVLVHDALPGFALALPELFAAADPPRPPANTPR